MRLKRVWKVVFGLVIFLVVAVISAIVAFNYLLTAVDKKDSKDVVFTIKPGTSTSIIAKDLMDAKLIHNDKFFIVYSKLKGFNNLQASSYKLKRSMNMKEIIKIINNGDGFNPEEVKITFKEGKNVRSIAKVISESTNNKYDDVIKKLSDREYVKTLIEKYWFLENDVQDKDIYYPLEGYLFPNTYIFKNKDVSIDEVITKMLDQTDVVLSKYKDAIKESKYSAHEVLTLSSIVELEGVSNKDRPTIASVFYNRLDKGISLGSDVTACYAQKIDDTALCHNTANFNYKSKYNTRVVTNIGLPIGPICNPSEQSINAVLNPVKSNYIYFVADKNKNIYFFETNKEFELKIKELKKNGDWL